MTNAIVTITCPHCGGSVEGIQATNIDQTIKCVFCGTELHVPRVGEVVVHDVVHEVIREVPSEPVFVPVANDAGLLRKPANPLVILGVLAAMACVMIPVMCSQQDEAQTDTDDYKQKEAAQAKCEADCKSECVHAGDHEDTIEALDEATRKELADTDRLICSTTCEQQRDCSGIHELLKKR